jgi:hypothetical protein
MSGRRDLLLIGGLFAALVLFIVFGPSRQPPQPPAAPTTHSTSERGAQALYEWVGRMGYQPQRLEYREYQPDPEAAALVVLSPSVAITPEEASLTLDWVEQGGTLILADDTSGLFGSGNALLAELKVDIAPYTGTITIERAGTLQPALDQPAVAEAAVQAGRRLVPRRDDYAALIGTPTDLIIAGIRHGEGYVYISATAYPFTNEGLREEQNARLVLNMLRRIPAGGRVLFDEFHHGYMRPPSSAGAALGTPWGWAGAYAALVVAIYLILSGRRFGRPVPLREEVRRRSSAEYVESIADLLLRGGKRGYMLRHYHTAFKRRLARPYGINPALDDTEFVRELARARMVDETHLLSLLSRLRSERATEEELVRTVAEADSYQATGNQ